MKRRQPASRVKLNPEAVWAHINRLSVSQNQLAERVGISSGYFSQLMSGTRCPSAEVLVGLMDALRVADFEELFILEIVSSSGPEDVPAAVGAPAFDAEGPGELQPG